MCAVSHVPGILLSYEYHVMHVKNITLLSADRNWFDTLSLLQIMNSNSKGHLSVTEHHDFGNFDVAL